MSGWAGCAVSGCPFAGSPGSVICVLAASGAWTVPLRPVAAIFAVADSVPRLRPGFAWKVSW